MNKNGFILIEVLISIMILSFSGLALLEVASNQKKLYKYSSEKLYFSKYASIVLNEHSTDLHNKNIVLYDILKSRYDFRNESVVKKLKEMKISYKQKYKSGIKLTINDNEEFNILIDEITISNDIGTTKYLTVKE